MPAEKARSLTEGKKAARTSTIAAALMLVSKWTAGTLSGSIALLADALHSLLDVVTCAAVWFGLRLSMEEPTESFPYGYYKAETLASLPVSLVIVLSGIQILLESARRILAPSPVSLTTLAMLVAGSSSLLSYSPGTRAEWGGRSTPKL